MTVNYVVAIVFGTFVSTIVCDQLFSNGSVCNTSTGNVGFCVHIDNCLLSAGNSMSRISHSNVLNATESACNPLNDTNIVCCPRYDTVESSRIEQHKRKLIEEFEAKVGQCGIDNLDRSKEFPWTVQIFHQKLNKQNETRCDGVLISDRHVLTAAHCVDLNSLREYDVSLLSFVRLSKWNTTSEWNSDQESSNDSVIDVSIAKTVVHHGYDRESISRENDIAIIELRSAVTHTKSVRPVCLPIALELRNETYDGDRVTTAGWNKDEQDDIKLRFDFEITPNAECANIYKAIGATITGSHICTRSIDQSASVDMCRGFSGSPLMIRDNCSSSVWRLVGIVSFGPQLCDYEEWPFVSTRIDNYIDWILENIQ